MLGNIVDLTQYCRVILITLPAEGTELPGEDIFSKMEKLKKKWSDAIMIILSRGILDIFSIWS